MRNLQKVVFFMYTCSQHILTQIMQQEIQTAKEAGEHQKPATTTNQKTGTYRSPQGEKPPIIARHRPVERNNPSPSIVKGQKLIEKLRKKQEADAQVSSGLVGEETWSYAIQLVQASMDAQDNALKKIKKMRKQLKDPTLKPKAAKNIREKLRNQNELLAEYEKVINEITVLENSDQGYQMKQQRLEGDSEGATFFKDGLVTMYINTKDIEFIAHEFHHGYQFEQGELSLGYSPRVGGFPMLHDKGDEHKAYGRQHLFEGGRKSMKYVKNPEKYKVLSPKYKDLPEKTMDIRNHKDTKDLVGYPNNPRIEKALKIVADYYHVAFRANGVTFVGEKRK